MPGQRAKARGSSELRRLRLPADLPAQQGTKQPEPDEPGAEQQTGGAACPAMVQPSDARLQLLAAGPDRIRRRRPWVSDRAAPPRPNRHPSNALSRADPALRPALPATLRQDGANGMPFADSLQATARPERGWATKPSVLESQPEEQMAQAVGGTRSPSASWRISVAG